MVNYTELVSFIASSLVTKPEVVQITSSTDDNNVLKIMIYVAPEDTGRIIGRKGATINAIRQIVRVSAAKGGEEVNVDVVEQEQPQE